MTVPNQDQIPENKPSDKELNFRALESKYQQQLAVERSERERLQQELNQRQPQQVEEEDDSEPYVDKKKLSKTLAKFGQETQKQTQSEIQKAVHTAIQEEKRSNWLKSNPDFYKVLEQHAEAFANKDPELAESILQMPEGFDRQKLVYKNIKALGIDKPQIKEQSIQDKVDANRRTPYYQPSGSGTAPYSAQGDFSKSGQKNAYEKMQQLKNNLRLG